MSGSGWGRHSKSCCKTPLGNLAVSTARHISRGLGTSSTTGVWNLCHISRAGDVVREGDIHHTRSIKTNSAVNLSRKPGLDLCCDLLQHLQGVLRTYLYFLSFYIIIHAHRFCSYHHHSNCRSYEIDKAYTTNDTKLGWQLTGIGGVYSWSRTAVVVESTLRTTRWPGGELRGWTGGRKKGGKECCCRCCCSVCWYSKRSTWKTIYKFDMKLKLAWGIAYRKPKDRLESYYITM